MNSSSMSFSRPVTLARNGGSPFDHKNFFNDVLPFFIRRYFSLLVYLLAKLTLLDEFLDLLLELPTTIDFMLVVSMVPAVLGRTPLIVRGHHLSWL